MKIARLKRQADALADDARSARLQYKSHAGRSLSIVRRRVGSSAGLAISFSLGFMAGTGTAGSKKAGTSARHRQRGHEQSGFVHQIAHGPLGETALKLATAFVARSLMKVMQERSDESQVEAAAGGSSVK
jgi:hypothetical protein